MYQFAERGRQALQTWNVRIFILPHWDDIDGQLFRPDLTESAGPAERATHAPGPVRAATGARTGEG